MPAALIVRVWVFLRSVTTMPLPVRPLTFTLSLRGCLAAQVTLTLVMSAAATVPVAPARVHCSVAGCFTTVAV